MGNRYVDQFLALNCAGDVLNAVGKINKPEKEISESMAIVKHLKEIVLKEPNRYEIFDLCAGNALTSILIAHLLPVGMCFAVDKEKRLNGNYGNVSGFMYLDPIELSELKIDQVAGKEHKDIILISVHPCQAAREIVHIYNNGNFKALIMMPCCEGVNEELVSDPWLSKRMNRYDRWTYSLACSIEKIESKVKIYTNRYCLSPKCNVITAIRG